MTVMVERAVLARGDVLAWLYLVAAITLLNIGNLMLDAVAKTQGLTLNSVLSPTFILSLGALGSAFLVYVRALARLPLAVAYPIMVGVTLLVVALTNYLWHDVALSPTQALGMLMLFGGVAMISTATRPDGNKH